LQEFKYNLFACIHNEFDRYKLDAQRRRCYACSGRTACGGGLVVSELFCVSNLLSLSRILAAPIVGYFLWKGDALSTAWALLILVLAAITDGLDGYVARKRNQITRLGLILDPLADKILAGSLVIMLVFFRDFPIWLAAVILGRDLVILAAAAVLMKGASPPPASNLTGKYTFAAIAVLVISSVIRYPFGVQLMTYTALILMAASLVNYTRLFLRIRSGQGAVKFVDRPAYRFSRAAISVMIAVLYFSRLYGFLMD
jgi:CDP-diacylglycerol--glycerol-3-phosphate 3-phosphatidyltransferase